MATGDLQDATFFDARILSIVGKILAGSEKRASAVSAFEQKLLERADEVRELNGDLSGKLTSILSASKSYISVQNGLMFLFAARTMNLLDDAVMTLEFAAREQRTLSARELVDLLKNSGETPIVWALSILGSEIDDRYTDDKPQKSSSIDIDRLRSSLQ